MSNALSKGGLFTQLVDTVVSGVTGVHAANTSFSSSGNLKAGISFSGLLMGMMRPSGQAGTYISQSIETNKREHELLLEYWLSGAFDDVVNNNSASKKVASLQEKTLSPEQLSVLLGIQPQQLLGLLQNLHQSNPQHSLDDKSRQSTSQEFKISLQDIFKTDYQPTAMPIQFQNLSLNQLQHLQPNLAQQVPHYTSGSGGFSEEFTALLQKAFSQRQSVRVSLSDETALVLKFSAAGKVSAHFLTSSQADEWRLKQELNDLQQRLDAKSLPYDELTVNAEGDERQRRRNNRGNPE